MRVSITKGVEELALLLAVEVNEVLPLFSELMVAADCYLDPDSQTVEFVFEPRQDWANSDPMQILLAKREAAKMVEAKRPQRGS